MANRVFVDQYGRLYQGTSARDVDDSEILYPSTQMLATLPSGSAFPPVPVQTSVAVDPGQLNSVLVTFNVNLDQSELPLFPAFVFPGSPKAIIGTAFNSTNQVRLIVTPAFGIGEVAPLLRYIKPVFRALRDTVGNLIPTFDQTVITSSPVYRVIIMAGDSNAIGQGGSNETIAGIFSGMWYAPVNSKVDHLSTFQTRTTTKGAGTVNAGTVNPVITQSLLAGALGDFVSIVQADASVFTGPVIARNAATPSITVQGTTTSNITAGAIITVNPRNVLDTIVSQTTDFMTTPVGNYIPVAASLPLPNIVAPPGPVCALNPMAALFAPTVGANERVLLINIGVQGTTLGVSPANWNLPTPFVPLDTFNYGTDTTVAGAAARYGLTRVQRIMAQLNPASTIAALVLMVGTNDALAANSKYTWLTRAANLVNGFRTQIPNNTTMPVIMGRMRGSVVTDNPGATQGPCVNSAHLQLQYFISRCYTTQQPAYINDAHSTNGAGFNGAYDDSIHWQAPNQVGFGTDFFNAIPLAAVRTPESSDAVGAVTGLAGASTSGVINDANITFTPAANAGHHKIELRLTAGPGPYVDYTTNSGYIGELTTGGGATASNYIPVLLPSTGYDIRVTSYNYTTGQTAVATASFTTGSQVALPTTPAFTAQLLYEDVSVAALTDTSGSLTVISNSNTAGKLSLISIGGAVGKVLDAAGPVRTSAASQVRINHTGLAVSNNATFASCFSCPHADAQVDWILSNRTGIASGPFIAINAAGYLVAGFNGVTYVDTSGTLPITGLNACVYKVPPALFPTSVSGADHHVGLICNLNTSNPAFTARTLYLMLDNVIVATCTIDAGTPWLPGADQTVVGSPLTGQTGVANNCIGEFDDSRVYYNTALTFAQFDAVFKRLV